MSNPIFQAMGGRSFPMNNPMNMMQAFQKFRQTFQGDPKAEIDRRLKSGEITQEQVDAAFQQARQMGLIR